MQGKERGPMLMEFTFLRGHLSDGKKMISVQHFIGNGR